MKRWIICIVTILLLAAAVFSRNAIEPGRFTGTWYLADTGETFDFREGIIQKKGGDSLDGAYAFSQDTITLFVTGQEEVRTLYWIADADGDILSADPMGTQAVFCRNPASK